MPASEPKDKDKAQIGLTPSGSAAMVTVMATGLFSAEGDAYKVGVAYALSQGLTPEDAADKGYQTKFNAAGGLDRDGTLRDLIHVLCPDHRNRPYAAAERLAEVGLTDLARRLAAHEALVDIISEQPGEGD